MSPSDILQSRFKLSSHYILSHRIVLAPMTRMRASPTGIPHPRTAEYYFERATQGGLLISEGIVIDPRAKGYPNTPGLWNEDQIEAWKPITAGVKKKGGVFFAQIWHVGRNSVPSQTGGYPPLASTKTPLPGNHQLLYRDDLTEPHVESQAMSFDDIKDVVGQFARAAKNAIRAGFDGIELHAANGYLFDTFIHDNINDRTDQYGGSLENRLRFTIEVVDAVVAAIGKERTAIRLSPFVVLSQALDSDRITTYSKYCEELEKRGLAYVHMIEARYVNRIRGKTEAERREQEKAETDPRYTLWTFRRILKTTPLIGAGGYTATSAREAIAEGRVDLTAFGRDFTSNPDLPQRLFDGLPLTRYDRNTFYCEGLEGYLGWKTAGED